MSGATGAFEDMFVRLQQITAGEESYGEGRRYEQGTRFYLEHLVEECARRARVASPGLPEEVDLLISMTGHSPRLTILAYRVLKPKRLVIVPSEQADDAVDTIHEHVLADNRLRASEIRVQTCDPTDPLDIYRLVKRELELHQRRCGNRLGEVFVDITAGRKVMAATAALAAWQFDVRLCYIDGEYAEGRAVPGSDRLLLLDNPSSLFGEQAMAAAEQAFSSGAFEAARSRFDELANRLAQPGRARFMASLSALYRAWCDLDLAALPPAIDNVRQAAESMRRHLDSGELTALYAQLDYLHRLGQGDESSLLLCFALLGDHYRRVGRHDFAALYSYRTIEGCLSAHLTSRYPWFTGDTLKYEGIDKQSLTDAYRDLLDQVKGEVKSRSLPQRSGLFANAALLAALGDPLARAAALSEPSELRELEDLARARNQSVLAHGKKPVDSGVSQDLHVRAMSVLHAYWALHHPDDELSRRLGALAFLRPGGAR